MSEMIFMQPPQASPLYMTVLNLPPAPVLMRGLMYRTIVRELRMRSFWHCVSDIPLMHFVRLSGLSRSSVSRLRRFLGLPGAWPFQLVKNGLHPQLTWDNVMLLRKQYIKRCKSPHVRVIMWRVTIVAEQFRTLLNQQNRELVRAADDELYSREERKQQNTNQQNRELVRAADDELYSREERKQEGEVVVWVSRRNLNEAEKEEQILPCWDKLHPMFPPVVVRKRPSESAVTPCPNTFAEQVKLKKKKRRKDARRERNRRSRSQAAQQQHLQQQQPLFVPPLLRLHEFNSSSSSSSSSSECCSSDEGEYDEEPVDENAALLGLCAEAGGENEYNWLRNLEPVAQDSETNWITYHEENNNEVRLDCN